MRKSGASSWRKRAAASVAVFLVGCAPAGPPSGNEEANQGDTYVGTQTALSIEAVRQAARAEANRIWGHDCGTVTIPDSAFIPVEITGGGSPEYAVLFSHATCDGPRSSSYFTGTGGGKVQFWSAFQDAPRLLFEHQLEGFTPTGDGFVSVQHGGYCPGGAGPGACLVTYKWSGTEDGFQVQSRRLYDYQHPGQPPEMRYDWNYPLPG